MSPMERTPGPYPYSMPYSENITAALGGLGGVGAGAMHDSSPKAQLKNLDRLMSMILKKKLGLKDVATFAAKAHKGKLLGAAAGGLLGYGAGRTANYYQDLGADFANKLHQAAQASKSAQDGLQTAVKKELEKRAALKLRVIAKRAQEKAQKSAAIAGALGGLASAANTGSTMGGLLGGLASETGGLLGGAAGAALAPAIGSAAGANPKIQQLLRQLGALGGYGLGGYAGYRFANSQMKDRQTREAGL